jgi:hypothetical protein
MNCKNIIKIFFHMNLNIKLYHWQTKLYSRHRASDELHSKILELIDTFIEVYIGKYNRPEFIHNFDINVGTQTGCSDKNEVDICQEDDIVKLIKEYTNYLSNDLPKQLNEKDTELLNIRDEMLAVFNQTLYLFTLM